MMTVRPGLKSRASAGSRSARASRVCEALKPRSHWLRPDGVLNTYPVMLYAISCSPYIPAAKRVHIAVEMKIPG